MSTRCQIGIVDGPGNKHKVPFDWDGDLTKASLVDTRNDPDDLGVENDDS